MNSFNLFLHNNTDSAHTPDNTPSTFNTVYHDDIELKGNWEVGVKSFSHPKDLYTTDGTESISCCYDTGYVIEGPEPDLSQEFITPQRYVIPKTKGDSLKNYTWKEMIEAFSSLDIVKRKLCTLTYKAKYNKFVLEVLCDNVVIVFEYLFHIFALCMKDQDNGFIKGKYMSARQLQYDTIPTLKKDWWMIVYPLYRMEKRIIQFGEASENIYFDDAVKRLNKLCDNRVIWKVIPCVNKKGVKYKRIILHKKPDPLNSMEYTILQFNEAAINFLGLWKFQTYPRSHDKYRNTWRAYWTYRYSKHYGYLPLVLEVYNRRIINRERFIPSELGWFKHTLSQRLFDSIDSFIAYLNQIKPTLKGLKLHFNYDKSKKRVSLNFSGLYPIGVRIESSLSKMLGFYPKTEFTTTPNNEAHIAKDSPRLERFIDFLCVHSNITEDVNVADKKAPVICIVPYRKPSNTSTNSVTHTFENPTYIPTLQTRVHQLNIKILDDNGDVVPFCNGKTFLHLHFRKRHF